MLLSISEATLSTGENSSRTQRQEETLGTLNDSELMKHTLDVCHLDKCSSAAVMTCVCVRINDYSAFTASYCLVIYCLWFTPPVAGFPSVPAVMDGTENITASLCCQKRKTPVQEAVDTVRALNRP